MTFKWAAENWSTVLAECWYRSINKCLKCHAPCIMGHGGIWAWKSLHCEGHKLLECPALVTDLLGCGPQWW